MDVTSAIWIISLLTTGVLGFIGWLIRQKFVQIDKIDDRLIQVETKMDILGDINTTLHQLRTDIEVIKVRMEQRS